MGSMAEDQALGFFPLSSRSPTRWCPVSRGKPHSDFPWISLHCEAIPASSFPGLEFCHLGFSRISHNLLWRPPCLRHLLHHPPPALALLTAVKVVRSSSRLSVGSPFNSRLFKPRFIAWLAQLPLHLLHALRPRHPHPVLPFRWGSLPGVQCWPSPFPPTLPLRLHLPLLTDFAPVVAAHLPCLRSAPRVTVTLSVTVAGVLTTAILFLRPFLLLLPLHRTCRASGCTSLPHTSCFVGFCSTHCTSRRCQLTRSPPPVQLRCRRPDCLEPSPPDCPVRFCNMHCTSPRCEVHNPLSLSGNCQGATRR